MAKHPVIDQEACVACESCVELAPGVFAMDDATEKAKVINPTGGSEDEIQEAIDTCPAEAISWEE